MTMYIFTFNNVISTIQTCEADPYVIVKGRYVVSGGFIDLDLTEAKRPNKFR